MDQFFGRLSLLQGWLPLAVQALTLLLLIIAIQWRARPWLKRVLPVALIAAVAVTALAYWYITSLGVAGDPAPTALWVWIALTGLAAAVVLVGWPGARWWRRALAVLSVPLCVLCAGLALNGWVGYFPTVLAAWNQLTSGPLPNEVDRLRVTEMQVAGTRPSKGVVVPVNIDDNASHFPHRRELVYLPPAWFNSNPPPRLPAVMMIGSAFNTPGDWLGPGGAFTAIDNFAAAHHGFSPVLVFVDPTGSFDNDTECVNGSRGNAADHLTKDVVPFVVSNFGVRADRASWGVAGWSMGGTCAVDLAVMHPELFSAFVDIAGDRSPNVGPKDQTVAKLFGGNHTAWAAFDPLTVIARHGRYTGLSGWFDVPGSSEPRNVAQEANSTAGAPATDPAANPEGQDAAAHALCAAASANGVTCAVVSQPGRHDWPFAAQAFAAALPWLASTLGTPEAEPVQLPRRGGESR
ncbi:putative esterase family protein [Mycobacterium europaeum]|uniref:Putative esterase family protein n=1 Tax=Mycobacterium europaeum TaxID=761804 RepID=A0A0U1D5U7_9MYCO|nr:alpha/beta hydrolase-fold protein [Mycobacterium europaeum]CQD07786.1 putative esterase family protein [Mycobacterium europaeum]